MLETKNNMKRVSISLVLVFTLFSGCSGDDLNKRTIVNLTGYTWYDATVYFMTVDKESAGNSHVGTVEISGKCTVTSNSPYFRIHAKDSEGKIIVSRDLGFDNDKTNTVTKDDLR
jgi:hypothetical protein